VTESQDPAVDQTEGSPSPVSQPATPGTELRTFLIADIRGYTTYTRERGDEAGAALAARFGELVAEVVPAHDGFLLELRGDEALVVFVSARKALRAAIDLQAKFVQAELPRGVGIGLDAGEAIPVGSGYRGTALNLAARLCAEAGPGETMASEAVIHLAAKMDGIAYVDARALRLKGYVDSVRVVDVVPSERAKGRRLASGDGARGPRTREANDDDFIWVTDLEAPHIARIDQKTGVVTDQSFAKDASDDAVGVDVTAGAGSVWVSRPDADPPEIVRLNRVTGAIEARIPVEAWGVTFGAGGLWWWRQGTLGRIDPITNEETFSLDLATDTFLGNIYIGGEDAWTSSTSTGRVWRVDRSGHQTTYTLPPGVSEFAATDRTMWATNASTGQLIGIDLVSGQQDRTIETGHATVAVAAGGNELMIAVAPTVDEYIAGLQGSVLSLATDGIPWWDPAPDPPDVVNDQVRQSLYLTCANLLGHPDKPGPEGTELVPEVADMPSVSADGLTYTFTIRPGYQFSPPSNEQVTADTFRYTLERALSPLYGDAPGPNVFGDIAGAQDYREGTVDHVRGLSVAGNQLNITLEKPAPDILERLASSFACPVPIGTPSLRSGLNPDPPVAGDGPYYLAQRIPKWLVVFKKNPNYHGSRLQPFDAIVIRTKTSATTAIGMVSNGTVDGAMLNGGDSLTGPASALAAEWGPGSPHATQGDQRWFGGSGTGIDFIALNPSSPTLKDPDIRHAISLALDRVELGSIWVNPQTAELLIPSVRGSDPSAVVQPPNLEAANALMKGRQVKLTMLGFPEDWGCGRCRDYEIAVTGQLKAIGITVTVRHGDPDNHPGPAFDKGSDVDLIAWGMGSDYPDPVALLGGLHDIPWIGPANLAELDRLNGLSGQDRVDGVVAFAHRLVDEQFLILPTSHAGTPFFLSDRLGCAFVQEAIGTVDFLSLCIKDSATPAASASPSP
jgi:ABC-type transport system substrate-binding protein/class 3 adenylate cyclase